MGNTLNPNGQLRKGENLISSAPGSCPHEPAVRLVAEYTFVRMMARLCRHLVQRENPTGNYSIQYNNTLGNCTRLVKNG